MKKVLIMVSTIIAMILCMCACGDSADSNSSDNEKSKEVTYKVGDTWTVDGQWEFTIDKVEATDERNEFEESDPAQVIVISYHYKNLGYEDESGLMDGLFLDVDSAQVIDSDGNVCSPYALGSIEKYAQETPVDAKCAAESSFGLVAKGSPVKLVMDEYDGNGNEQKATFELEF